MKLELKYHNSAGRLLAVLNGIPKAGSYEASLPQFFYPNIKDLNSKKIHIRRKNTMNALGELHIIYSQFIKDMQCSYSNPPQIEILLDGLENISDIIYPSNLATAVRELTVAESSLLEVCAAGLIEEQKIDEDELERIRDFPYEHS